MKRIVFFIGIVCCLTSCQKALMQPVAFTDAVEPVLYAHDRFYMLGAYDRWEIQEQTADHCLCVQEYDSIVVDGTLLQATVRITSEGGQTMNRAEIVLSSLQPSAFSHQIYVGGGIRLYDSADSIYTCDHCGIIACAHHTPDGHRYAAVVTPHGGWQDTIDGTLFSLQPYELGDTMTFFFGIQEGADTYPADQDFFDAITW